MYDVICYGTLCQDRIIRIPRYPHIGTSIWIEQDSLKLGGEAANTALALNAWGQKTLLLGSVLGADERGQWLAKQLAALEHVDISRLERSSAAHTPYCLIMATPDAERTMFGRYFNLMQGQAVTELPPARVFTLDPYCGANAGQAARVAHRQGIKIVAMDVLEHPEIAEVSDIIVTSYQHIDLHAPLDALVQRGQEAAMRYSATVIVTAGERGSVALSPEGNLLHHQHAVLVPAERVLDATGCGDVYRAGLVCGEALEWPLEQSMAFGSAAAALNLMGMGGAGLTLPVDQTLSIARAGTISEQQAEAICSTQSSTAPPPAPSQG